MASPHPRALPGLFPQTRVLKVERQLGPSPHYTAVVIQLAKLQCRTVKAGAAQTHEAPEPNA